LNPSEPRTATLTLILDISPSSQQNGWTFQMLSVLFRVNSGPTLACALTLTLALALTLTLTGFQNE